MAPQYSSKSNEMESDSPKEGNIQLKCRLCECESSSIENYLRHQKDHIPKDSREKLRYLCNVCTYSSVVIDHVRKHLMRHYDIKPFKCPRCTWTCVTKYQLSQHKITHHLNLKGRRYAR